MFRDFFEDGLFKKTTKEEKKNAKIQRWRDNRNKI